MKRIAVLLMHAVVIAVLFKVELPVQRAYDACFRDAKEYATIDSGACKGEPGMQAALRVTDAHGVVRLDRACAIVAGERFQYQVAHRNERSAFGRIAQRVIESDFCAFFEQLGLIWGGLMACVVIWAYDPSRRRYVLSFLLGAASTGLIVTACKLTTGKIRPESYFNGDYTERFLPLLKGWVQHAPICFPSGHATHVFMTATFVALLYPRIAWMVYAAAVFTCASRVVSEAHWLSDVYAGAVLGHYTMHAVHAVFVRHEGAVLGRLPASLRAVLGVGDS
jgi:membrane-associated phospholipid phosphatase